MNQTQIINSKNSGNLITVPYKQSVGQCKTKHANTVRITNHY